MRNAKHLIIILVALMSMSVWQIAVEEAQAKQVEAADNELRELLTYSGPVKALQRESIQKLMEILHYDVYPVHTQIIDHQNLTHFGERLQDMTLAFRGLGKSTSGTIVRAIAHIIRDFDVRILITSATTEAPEEIHAAIHAHLTENETLVRLFGKFYGAHKGKIGRYSKRSSTVYQRVNRALGEGTITVLGVGKQAAMRHFDVVFCDDLVTLETSRTKTMKKNLTDWYGSTLVGTWLPHTVVYHIGTRYYPHDLWEDLQSGRADEKTGLLQDATLQIPMVENFSDPQEDWIPTHPERYPVNACVLRLRSAGRYHFLAQYQQDTKTGEGIVFSYSDFQWWGDGESMPPDDALHFQYSDLAAKKTDLGDYYVTVTISVADSGGERRIWVRDLVRERLGTKDQRASIVSQVKKWNPVQAGVEAVAMQAGFAEEIKEGSLLPVIPVAVEADKVFRAQRVSYLVDDHKVYFPLPESGVGKICAPLIEELTTFPEVENDDTVDAFVGALTLAILGDWYDGIEEAAGAGTREGATT